MRFVAAKWKVLLRWSLTVVLVYTVAMLATLSGRPILAALAVLALFLILLSTNQPLITLNSTNLPADMPQVRPDASPFKSQMAICIWMDPIHENFSCLGAKVLYCCIVWRKGATIVAAVGKLDHTDEPISGQRRFRSYRQQCGCFESIDLFSVGEKSRPLHKCHQGKD